jgi:hypothetical protein
MSTKRKSIISGLIFAFILVAGIFANGFNEEMTEERIKNIPGQVGVQQYREGSPRFGPREYLRIIETKGWLHEEEGEHPN